MAVDQDQVVKPFVKVRKVLKKVPKNPSPEQIHKLRTRMRRIEAALDALGMASQRTARRTLREEKPFRRRAGQIRDMDVLTSLAGSIDGSSDDECRLQLLEYLGAQRYRRARKLHATAQRNGPRLRKELGRCITRLEGRIGNKAPVRQKVTTAATIAARAIELCLELSGYPRLTKSNLHEFRLVVEQLRYTLQMATTSDAGFVHTLGDVKDKIGEWHDWEQLAEVARELSRDGRNSKLFTELNSKAELKYQQALRAAQQLRTGYLATFVPKKRPGKLTTATTPLLVASSLLAA